MAKAKKAETAAPEAAAPQEAQAAVQLTLQDLTLAANVINVCTSRGAIKAEEMTVVGALYDKLSAFLTANGVTRAPANEDKQGGTEEKAAA